MHKEWRPAEEIPVFNVYSPVAKRKKMRLVGRQTQENPTTELVLDGVFHELQNCLQSIGMGVDLLQLSQPDALECRTINLGIERASRLLREVQEFFFPPETYLSIRNLSEVLTEAVREVVGEAEGGNIRLLCTKALPAFQYDWFMFGRVLDRILRCACGLLSAVGGESIVSATIQEGAAGTYVEIKVDICGAGELGIEKDRVFTPFWRVNDYQTGLGLVLARQAVQSWRGQLTFEKINPCRAQFTLLLEAPPESISSGRGRKEESHGCVE
ncbi:MAG TPA: hypothetical protein VNN62_26105 [Methylomirabilota bacterium]|nr:hypothetical protein [Methylomirabilota bacterium]